jgi:hypothetical protein
MDSIIVQTGRKGRVSHSIPNSVLLYYSVVKYIPSKDPRICYWRRGTEYVLWFLLKNDISFFTPEAS